MNDFNTNAAMQRGKQLVAQRKQLEAHLARAEAENDTEYAGELIQEIANVDEQGAALNRLHSRYIAERNPVIEERESIFESKRHPQDGDDALALINYGKQPGHPTYLSPDEYNRQQRELFRRKARGEYQGKP
jgi:hypothetical protein